MYIFWYVWCLNGWAHICEKKKWKQVTSPECFCIGTRQSVPDSPSVFTLTHGKDWDFVVCLPSTALGKPAVNGRPPSRFLFLPSAFWALGKTFAECPIKDTRQSRLCRLKFRRVFFAECLGHSAKKGNLVVLKATSNCKGKCRYQRGNENIAPGFDRLLLTYG